jgi:hypothetical protein
MARLPTGLSEERGLMSFSGGDFYLRNHVQTGSCQTQPPMRRKTGALLAGVCDRGVTANHL